MLEGEPPAAAAAAPVPVAAAHHFRGWPSGIYKREGWWRDHLLLPFLLLPCLPCHHPRENCISGACESSSAAAAAVHPRRYH